MRSADDQGSFFSNDTHLLFKSANTYYVYKNYISRLGNKTFIPRSLREVPRHGVSPLETVALGLKQQFSRASPHTSGQQV